MVVTVGALWLTIRQANADDACHRALEARVRACADECVARAKAAVDPAIRERVRGYGCASNCMKLDMFSGHSCPNP